MALTFKFKLVTPTGVLFDREIEAVTASNLFGEFTVLAQHINYITSLVPGVVHVKLDDEHYQRFVVSGGLAEVKDGLLTILAPDAVLADKVDGNAANREVAVAEEKLRNLSFYEPDYANAEKALMLAQARQRAAELQRTASH